MISLHYIILYYIERGSLALSLSLLEEGNGGFSSGE